MSTDTPKPRKGHWPKGRRRNAIDPKVWAALRARLVELLEEAHAHQVRSMRAMAEWGGLPRPRLHGQAPGLVPAAQGGGPGSSTAA